jgi:hypothetical protein
VQILIETLKHSGKDSDSLYSVANILNGFHYPDGSHDTLVSCLVQFNVVLTEDGCGLDWNGSERAQWPAVANT